MYFESNYKKNQQSGGDDQFLLDLPHISFFLTPEGNVGCYFQNMDKMNEEQAASFIDVVVDKVLYLALGAYNVMEEDNAQKPILRKTISHIIERTDKVTVSSRETL